MFVDKARIRIKSGSGGDGCVSFRREKYVPDGGPDGGDGGNGGSVYFIIDQGLNTLTDFRHVRKYSAENGTQGSGKNCKGRSGQDIFIKVPPGTLVKDAESGRVIADMSGEQTKYCVLKGGKGGLGNQHFATSTMQAPKYAKPGQPGIELEVVLELKVIADVGLVGFPNAGKSTFLSRVTNAKPKIANYPFTTLRPNLGIVEMGYGEAFCIADIPGLIEGASQGVGLGHDFLRHVERTRILLHIVDAAGTEGRDPVEDIRIMMRELEQYSDVLPAKKQLIAANKMDSAQDSDVIARLENEYGPMGFKIYPISAVTGQGVDELLRDIHSLLKEIEIPEEQFPQEFDPNDMMITDESPFTVEYDAEADEYVIEGPRVEKMLGYTHLDTEKGFAFFQKFLRDNGMLKMLEELGIEDGDTVRIYGYSFEYYK